MSGERNVKEHAKMTEFLPFKDLPLARKVI